jgi:hypothetical protein
MADSRSGVERFISLADGLSGVVGGVVILAIAVAAMSAGGVAGWALGGSLLGLALVGSLIRFLRRH